MAAVAFVDVNVWEDSSTTTVARRDAMRTSHQRLGSGMGHYGVVVHRLEGSSFSNWIGTEQVRHFRFDGTDRLILSTLSSAGRWRLIWQRRDAATNGRA
jgi:hypothetical protein